MQPVLNSQIGMTPSGSSGSQVNNKAPAPAANASTMAADMFVDAKNENSNIMMNLQHQIKTRKQSDDCMQGATGLPDNANNREGPDSKIDVNRIFKQGDPNVLRTEEAQMNRPNLTTSDP